MNLEQLPYIVTIAQTGSLSQAARELGVSQPALSKYLKELERDCGLPLFDRVKKRLVPTEAGRLYLQSAQKILIRSKHTRTAIDLLEHLRTETIRLGCSANRGIALLAEVYPDFAKSYPQIQLSPLEIYARQAPKMVLNRELDAALVSHSGPAVPGLRYQPMSSEEYLFCVPSFHPAVRHSTFVYDELPYVDFNDFRNDIFILPEASTTAYGLINALFDRMEFVPQAEETTPNTILHQALIRSGLRVGFLPTYYLKPDPEIAYFRIENSPRLILYYITRSDRTYTGAERYFLFLELRYHLLFTNGRILWDDFLLGLMWEFDPIEATAQGLEAPHEHKNS